MAERYRIKEYRAIADAYEILDEDADGVEKCIASSFGGGITREDARHHMTGGQVLVARSRDTGQVAGFASTSIVSPFEQFNDSAFEKTPAGYFAGAAIAAEHQGVGLYNELFWRRLAFSLEDEAVVSIYTRTQNPLVFKGISRGLEQAAIQRRIRSASLAHVAIARAVYPGQLMNNMPEFFDDIDTTGGDAKIFIWDIAR